MTEKMSELRSENWLLPRIFSHIYENARERFLVSLGADPDGIFVAHNTVDVAWFAHESSRLQSQERELRKMYGLLPGPVVLYVGQLIPRKGAKYLLLAFRHVQEIVRDARLLIVGSGSQRDELVSICNRFRLGNVVFAGDLPYERLPEVYAVGDLLVLPSLEEVWGLVLNEAMASGLPVVCTENVGAGSDMVIQGKTGFRVPAKDAKALGSSIIQLLEDSDIRGRLGENGRTLVTARFSIQQVVNAFVAAINHVIQP